MAAEDKRRIAVISMARNDQLFIARWISYYGSQLGHENLFLILDGHDQPLPGSHPPVNVLRVPAGRYGRAVGDRNRAAIVTSLARALFRRYDIVIAHDIDEILVADPAVSPGLAHYLQDRGGHASLSALGLDVGQHLDNEQPVDISRPLLQQRSYAHVSARYTKAVVALRPVTWGSGFHRVRNRNFRIDPNLYLFHFGMADYATSQAKEASSELIEAGWKGHLDRRYELLDLIRTKEAMDGDTFFREARRRQTLFRPIYAPNKPGMLREKPVIRIPERFRDIV